MNTTAFILGLVGSVHCVAMCGPLTAVFSFRSKSTKGFIQSVVYQLSRVSVYMLLGALVGGLMSGGEWLGISQNIAIALGGLFFLVGLSYLLIKPAGASQFLIGKWIARLFSGIMKNEKIGVLRYVFSGMANGLLPCGMVYVALAGTTLTYSATSGAQYMMFFGLGTMPALLLVGAVSNWIKQKLAFFKSKYVISGFLIITGALMLFRGLSLDINYLSPQIKESQTKTDCYVKQ